MRNDIQQILNDPVYVNPPYHNVLRPYVSQMQNSLGRFGSFYTAAYTSQTLRDFNAARSVMCDWAFQFDTAKRDYRRAYPR